ncbi:MAG: hypothetical protein ACPL06_03465 [Candidatus Anstonellales archaeon]
MKLNKQYLWVGITAGAFVWVWANKLDAKEKLSDWQSTLQTMDTTGKRDALENYYKYVIKTKDTSAINWLVNYSVNDSLGKGLERVGFNDDIALTWLLIYSKDTSISSPDTVFWCVRHAIKEGRLDRGSLVDEYYEYYKKGYMRELEYIQTVETSFLKSAFPPKTTIDALLKLNTDKGVYHALRILGIAVYNQMGTWLDFAELFVEYCSIGRIAKQLKNLEKDKENNLLDNSCNQACLYAALIMAAKNNEKDKIAKDIAGQIDSLDFAVSILENMYTVDSSFYSLTSSVKISYDKASQDVFMKHYNPKAKKILQSAIEKYSERANAADEGALELCLNYFSYCYGESDKEATEILDGLKNGTSPYLKGLDENDKKKISEMASKAIKNKKEPTYHK